MRWIVIFSLCVFASAAQAEQFVLRLDQWSSPTSGQAVVDLPPLRQLMAVFETAVDSRIAIHHPGGDQGTAWAEEVRDWLVALGVPSSRIILEPGSGTADTLLLETLR